MGKVEEICEGIQWKTIQQEREGEQGGNKRTVRRNFRAGSHIRWGSRTDGVGRNKKNTTTVRIRRGEGERGLTFISNLLGNAKRTKTKENTHPELFSVKPVCFFLSKIVTKEQQPPNG